MLPRFEAHPARSAEDDGAQPELSVVIASYDSRTSVDVCLASLLRQSTDKPFEIILVDSATDGTAEHIREHYPRVRLLTSPERLYPGEARNRALAVARAPIIAFLDADCFVEENWVEAILLAHHSPHWLVGGAVDNGSRSLVSWAYYFCELSLWLPRSKPAEIPEIPSGCLSIKREAFEKHGPFLRDGYCSDTAFNWRAQQDGRRALSTPSIRVFHTINSTTREFVTHVTMHRRFFARVARSQKKIGRWQRWMLVAFAPCYPFALVALTAGRVLRCPRYLPQFVRSLPLVFLGCCARVWGELIGLLEEIPKPSALCCLSQLLFGIFPSGMRPSREWLDGIAPAELPGRAGYNIEGLMHSARVGIFVAALLSWCGCGRYADFTLPPPAEPPGDPGFHLHEPETGPVLRRGAPGEWDSVDVLNPSVALRNGVYYNLYSGYDGGTWRTGLATSADGLHWTKQGAVLSPGPRPWEGDSIAANGSVLVANGEFLYWYQAGQPPRIGLARSRDASAWRKSAEPVVPLGPRGSWDERGVADPYVIRAGGRFFMFYLGQDRARRQRLGLAASEDGVRWSKLRANPVLELGEAGAFDEAGLGEPAVWEQHGYYWMLYTGRDSREERRIGLARSRNGVEWQRVSGSPVFWGRAAWNRRVVCDPSVEVLPGEVRVWYGGGDVASPDQNLHGEIGVFSLMERGGGK